MKPDQDELKKSLSIEEFNVTQQCGTEAPFSGKYWNHHEDGNYNCVVCGHQLFDSQTKFESGSGWPSFDRPADSKNIRFLEDNQYGMRRTEVRCANCDAHLGHLFPDGPTETGDRFCINSAALTFQKRPSENNKSS
jgi:peptide-methionine (R)-S-oxide reductase